MLRRIDTIEHALIKFGCEIASESMDLGHCIFYGKAQTIMHTQRLRLSLWKIFEGRVIWERKMSECKDITRLLATRIGSTVDLDNVGKLIRVELL